MASEAELYKKFLMEQKGASAEEADAFLKAKGMSTETFGDKALQSAKNIGKASIEALPFAGSLAGGVIGTAAGPVGTVGGAGLGAAAGKSLQTMLEKYLLDQEKNRSQIYLDPITEGAMGATGEMGGALLAKGMTAVGKPIYRSGLKRIDQEVAKYGKEPVSDILEKEGVWGSAKNIQEQMDLLANIKANKANKYIEQATEAGGQVSMQEAMKPTLERIADIKASRSPVTAPLADELTALSNQFLDLEKPSLEGIPGIVTPQQGLQFKQELYQGVPKGAWNENAKNTAWNVAQKEMARGMKEATESSVGKTLSPFEQAQYSQLNDELGRLLTSKEKQMMQANVEGNRNIVTPVDAMIGASSGGLPMLALKKAADVAKLTGPRTAVGMGLQKAGESELTKEAWKKYLMDKQENIKGHEILSPELMSILGIGG